MQAFACLMYHNVCENGSLSDASGEWAALSPSIKSYFVEESAFAAQMALMQRSVDLIKLERVERFFASPVPRQRDISLPDARPPPSSRSMMAGAGRSTWRFQSCKGMPPKPLSSSPPTCSTHLDF